MEDNHKPQKPDIDLNVPQQLSMAFEALCSNTFEKWKADIPRFVPPEKELIARKKNRRKKNRKNAKGESAAEKETDCNGNDRAQDECCLKSVDDVSDNEFEQQIIDFELRLSKQADRTSEALEPETRKLKPNVSVYWIEELRRKTATAL